MKIKGEIKDQTDLKLIEILDRIDHKNWNLSDKQRDLYFDAQQELIRRLKMYREYFEEAKHVHVAGTTIGLDIDTCAKCGKDLRNDIHIRKR